MANLRFRVHALSVVAVLFGSPSFIGTCSSGSSSPDLTAGAGGDGESICTSFGCTCDTVDPFGGRQYSQLAPGACSPDTVSWPKLTTYFVNSCGCG